MRWYRRAAEQGNPRGQNGLGWMYENGRGVREDDAEAVRWYQRAAEQGYARAQNNLGHMYSDGHGVRQDHADAVQWVSPCSRTGRRLGSAQPRRQVRERSRGYGVMTRKPSGGTTGPPSRGLPRHRTTWASCTRMVAGVRRDRGEAIRWFTLGGRAGSSKVHGTTSTASVGEQLRCRVTDADGHGAQPARAVEGGDAYEPRLPIFIDNLRRNQTVRIRVTTIEGSIEDVVSLDGAADAIDQLRCSDDADSLIRDFR